MSREELKDLTLELYERKEKKSVYFIYAPNQISTWKGFTDQTRCLETLENLNVLAEGVRDTGLLLYDIDLPQITKPVSNQLIRICSEYELFLGLKDSRSTENQAIASRIKFVQDELRKKFFSGPDTALALVGELGGFGRVSGMANLLPTAVQSLVANHRRQELQYDINMAFQALLDYSDDFVTAMEAIVLFQRDKDVMTDEERDRASRLYNRLYTQAA